MTMALAVLLMSVGEEKLADQSGNRGRDQGRWWSLSNESSGSEDQGGGMKGRGWGRREREEGAGKVAHGAWVPGWGV